MLGQTADISPDEFERLTESFLRRIGAPLKQFKVTRRERIPGKDGLYEVDVTVRFEALGANFIVLVECKHHKSPIKRELVQVLNDRIRSTGAHKGMLFSTARFQSGALEYAVAHGISLVHVAEGFTTYVTKADALKRASIDFTLWLVTLSESGSAAYSNVTACSHDAALQLLGWPELTE